MFFALEMDAVENVAEHQQRKVNRTCGVNHGDRNQRHAEGEGVVFLPLFDRTEQHQDPDHNAKLTRNAWVSRIEGFGEQAEAETHGKHGVTSCTVAVQRSHHAQKQDKQGVVS